jgi:hypothetical protein
MARGRAGSLVPGTGIKRAELLEVSITHKLANPYTRVLSVRNNCTTTPLPYSTGSTSNTVTCTNTRPDLASDPRVVLKQLDAIAAEVGPHSRTGEAVEVDAFVAQVREELGAREARPSQAGGVGR